MAVRWMNSGEARGLTRTPGVAESLAHVLTEVYAMGRAQAPLEEGAPTETAAKRVEALEFLARLVRERCRQAVPQWAPELRDALAALDATDEQGSGPA